MEKSGPVFIVLGLVLVIAARPQGFDDEGEISVPRSPKVQGPALVSLHFAQGKDMEKLLCQIEGSPTPTVIWSKDGQEIRNDIDPYNTTYDVSDGKAQLTFLRTAYVDGKHITGNFTCIAANFLGRAQKTFMISRVVAADQSSSTPTLVKSTTQTANSNGTTASANNFSTATTQAVVIKNVTVTNNGGGSTTGSMNVHPGGTNFTTRTTATANNFSTATTETVVIKNVTVTNNGEGATTGSTIIQPQPGGTDFTPRTTVTEQTIGNSTTNNSNNVSSSTRRPNIYHTTNSVDINVHDPSSSSTGPRAVHSLKL